MITISLRMGLNIDSLTSYIDAKIQGGEIIGKSNNYQ